MDGRESARKLGGLRVRVVLRDYHRRRAAGDVAVPATHIAVTTSGDVQSSAGFLQQVDQDRQSERDGCVGDMQIELAITLNTADDLERTYLLRTDRPYQRVPAAGEILSLDDGDG